MNKVVLATGDKILYILLIYKILWLSVWVSVWVSGCVADGRENYWADQDETSTTYSLQPRDGSAQKKFEKIQRGARGGPFLLKKCVFLEYFDYL